LALHHRLPTVSDRRSFAEAGGLMACGVSNKWLYRRPAVYVDRILKGAKPGDLPIEQPTAFELIVNLKTAAAFGVAVPPSVAARADEMIERKCRWPRHPAEHAAVSRGRRNPLHLDPVSPGPNLRQFVVHLQPEPQFGAAAECFRQANGHLGGDAGLAVEQLGQCLARDSEASCRRSHGQLQGLKALLPYDSSRMRRLLHLDVQTLSVIVQHIDFRHMIAVEAEYDAPICAHRHRPEAPAIALERMQSKPRQSQVARRPRAVENEQDILDLLQQIGSNSLAVAVQEQLLQPFVPETSHHGPILPVTYQVSICSLRRGERAIGRATRHWHGMRRK
jgi:putative ABC transport system substrate-binding protein